MPYTLTFEFLRINLKIYKQNKMFDVHVKLDPSVWPNIILTIIYKKML